MSESRKNGKYLCADMLAVFGALLLLGLEYLKTAGFMEMPVTQESSLLVAVRWFCLSGAMLLSGCMGYVMSTKKLSLKSVKPILRVVYIYVVSSLLALLMRRVMLDEYFTQEELLDTLRTFTATDTARFAGMYILLLLFAPFLSAAFHDLKTYNARLAFLAVTAGVSTLQPMLIISGKYLLPEWCKMLAPFAGFIGGAFVRRYSKSLNRVAYFLLLVLLCGLQTTAVMYICTERGILYYPQFDSMASLPALMTAMLTLSLFHSDKKGDTPAHRFFSNASGGTIAALILGDTVIDFALPSLAEYFPEQEQLIKGGLLTVPVIFILCCAAGIFIQIPVFILKALFGEDAYEYIDEEPEVQEIPEKPVQAKPIRKLEPIPEPEPEPEPVFEPEPIPEPEPIFEPEPEPIPEPEPEPELKPVSAPVPEPIPEPVRTKPVSESHNKYNNSDIDELIAKITGGNA